MTVTRPLALKTKDDPAEVARQGFEALMRGDQKVVAESLSTKAMASRVLSAPVAR